MRLALQRLRPPTPHSRLPNLPDPIEKTKRSHYPLVRPGRFLFGWRDEQRVHALGVGAVAFDQLIRRHDIEPRLRHLPDFGNQLDALAIRFLLAKIDFAQRHPGQIARRIAKTFLRDHPLVEQARERLLEVDEPHVVERAADETRVKQVQDRMLDAADVLIDRQPAIRDLRVEDFAVVAR